MGRYINPPESVKSGENLSNKGFGDDYLAYVKHANGRLLVGYGDRGIFQFAVVIPHRAEFDHFYQQLKDGQLLSLDFYAVSNSAD